MAALQRATAFTEIAPFLRCCDDMARKGTQTLSVPAVCHRLDHLEAEWSVVTSISHLTAAARAQAMRHYCEVYDVCARTVPLPQAVWDRWATGITSSFSTADSPSAMTTTPSQSQLETLRVAMVTRYWDLYCRVHWGCACAAKPRLALALEAARKAAAVVQASSQNILDTHSSTAVHTVESLEQLLADPLHAFAKLSVDMSHLFGDYAVVGAVEREWLSEEVGLPLGPGADTAVEALVRRSFKRDLQVPSAALPTLLQEYEASEIEEKKAKEVIAVGAATLKSPWMRASSTLHTHLVQLSSASLSSAEAAETSQKLSHVFLYDDTAFTLLEDVVRELRNVPHGRGSLPALAIMSHRLIEWQPARTSPSHASLSGSQTQFYLLLLHQWFAQYVASQHRWSVTDPFNAPDDSDVWAFVLDRHSFCLQWALASWGPKRNTAATAPLSSAQGMIASGVQTAFMLDFDAKVDTVRAVFYSVVHCLQLYRASVVGFANPEKREARLAAARTAAQEWMGCMGVPVFCRGLLGDLLDTTEEWEDTDSRNPALQLWALQAEAELKVIMFDTMQLLGLADDSTTERLQTLVQVALDMAALWSETAAEEGKSEHASLTSTPSLFAAVVALVARVLQRIRVSLQRSLAAAPELSAVDAKLYTKVVEWIKKMISLAAAHVAPEALNVLWDEYLLLVSLPCPSPPGTTSENTASLPHSFPTLVSYASATRRTVGPSSSSSCANGGIDDIAWERRTAFRLRRRALSGEVTTEAGKPPAAKKPRTE